MAEKVALLDSINPAANQVFESAGLEVITFPKSLPPDELAELTQNVRLLGIRSGPKIPAEVIESGANLEAIGCFCVGTNHVNHEAANQEGIAIFNSVHENTRSVAEHVIASTFGLLRRIPEHNLNLHHGEWTKTDEQSYEIRGKTMGIIGYGAIGGQVSVLAESIGMDVIYYDPAPKIPAHGRAKRLEIMEDVMAKADVITLHVPGGPRTRGMINRETIAAMRPGSYLINTSRGEVVDYEAVAEAIESGQLGGIAADVFEDEPSKQGDKFDHVLRRIGKAILTPHIAGSTIEAQADIGKKIAEKLLLYLKTGNSEGSVNLPEISSLNGLPPTASRLLNVHDNVSGVMADLSGAIAEAELNVVSSIQKTRGDIGYAAFDIESGVTPDLVQSIKTLPHNRRTRIIG
jgi:D-3-phosphoglycerate dehydrogenase / 2-oxoglutarate reductase